MWKRILVIGFIIIMLLVITEILWGRKIGFTEKPLSPLKLELSVSPFSSGNSTLNREAELKAFLTLSREVNSCRNVQFNITLPRGLRLKSGQTSWQGQIASGKRKEIRLVVETVKRGNWSVKASVVCLDNAPSHIFGDRENIYISISQENIIVSKKPFTSTRPGELTRLPENITVVGTNETGGGSTPTATSED